ncbi:helix-turn-helix domain-containing protein [Robertkochia flava]|uniref:helix-turn-helix domain-containing protein n=1 Tax=Robertkochia flava TaxID=3447986 RepID=UPI001CCCD159|nr:helix-turn-helix domain-containing protein [Robertkochia marina]
MESVLASIKGDSKLQKLRQIVLDNLENEHFNVESFASKAGMSRSELYRKIKRLSGKSVTQFIREIRLEKALKILSSDDLSASEVAFAVGFNSPTYFSKCFKEKYGFTPGETEFHQGEVEKILYHPPKTKKKDWFGVQLVYIPIVLTASIIIFGTLIWMRSGSDKSGTSGSTLPGFGTILPEGESPSNISENSIAILPLYNWTGEPSNDFMGQGLAHDLINMVSRNHTLGRVAPMLSVIPYKDSVPNVDLISKDLDVAFLLWGGIQKSGDFYKFSIDIINAVEDSLYLSKVYVIDYKNTESYYLMEADIADQISGIMGRTPVKMFSREAPTTSSKARNYYFQGIQKSNILTRQSWENALLLFNKAIEEDPVYIDAYEALAKTWGFGGMNWGYTSQQEAWGNMKYYLQKILQIDPGHKTALFYLKDGYFYFELDIAPEIPGYSNISHEAMLDFNADFAGKMGRHLRAIEGNLLWLKNEPYAGTVYALLAINYYFLGDYDKARTLLAENYDIYKTDLDFLRESAKAWYFLGDYENMEMAVTYFFENFKERPLILRWLRAMVADQNKDENEVENQIRILQQKYREGASGSPAWFIALYHAYKGNKAKTMEWLEKSYKARETEMTWLAQEPDLKIVGDDPRYIALLDSMHFPQSARTHVNTSMISQK